MFKLLLFTLRCVRLCFIIIFFLKQVRDRSLANERDDSDERMMASYKLRRDVDDDVSPMSREPAAVHVSSTANSVVLQLRLPRPTQPCSLTRANSLDSLQIKYRRMKCAVVVMATLMIAAGRHDNIPSSWQR